VDTVGLGRWLRDGGRGGAGIAGVGSGSVEIGFGGVRGSLVAGVPLLLAEVTLARLGLGGGEYGGGDAYRAFGILVRKLVPMVFESVAEFGGIGEEGGFNFATG